MSAAEKLSAWRIAKNHTQAAAAKLVGVSAATWCDWENAKKIPRVDRAEDIERITDGAVTVADWASSARAADETVKPTGTGGE